MFFRFRFNLRGKLLGVGIDNFDVIVINVFNRDGAFFDREPAAFIAAIRASLTFEVVTVGHEFVGAGFVPSKDAIIMKFMITFQSM